MATNLEMIEDLAEEMEFDFDGDNLKTFAEWQKEGYTVRKGEKAFMALDLWKPFKKKLKNEDGSPKMKDGKQEEETRFMLKLSHLFTVEQVEIGVMEKKPKKATTAKKKKPTAKKKQTA